jgi:lipoprotein-releasing system ATP-binding protein
MLLIQNIYKKYATKNGNQQITLEVLKGVSCAVETGEIVAITGKSGAGKSTLLHIAGTLDKADKGKVLINNTEINSLSASQLSKFRNQNIGFIFQFHHLLPEFTALENICIPAWIAKSNKKDAEKRAMQLLERMGLAARHNHKPRELSGGEQQRVAIARALINNPKLILADEPTGNLDTKNGQEVFDLIKELRTELQQTFIVVTHNQELANQSDRILHMEDGHIISE